MTDVSPLGPGLSTGGPAPAGRAGGWGMRRLLLVALAVGFVAFAASGIATYAGVSSSRSAVGPVECEGGGAGRCIPSLKSASVINALKAQGHDCSTEPGDWVCALGIGEVRYESRLVEVGDQIGEYLTTVRKPDGSPPSNTTVEYLVWLACLPFADDPATESDIRNWVTQRLNDSKDAKVKIAKYGYELDTSDPGYIMLKVRGVTPQ
jgi:hypothetical protein